MRWRSSVLTTRLTRQALRLVGTVVSSPWEPSYRAATRFLTQLIPVQSHPLSFLAVHNLCLTPSNRPLSHSMPSAFHSFPSVRWITWYYSLGTAFLLILFTIFCWPKAVSMSIKGRSHLSGLHSFHPSITPRRGWGWTSWARGEACNEGRGSSYRKRLLLPLGWTFLSWASSHTRSAHVHYVHLTSRV